MDQPDDAVFDLGAWTPTLEKYGAVVELSVTLYGTDAQIVCGPLPATPIVTMLQAHGSDPGVFAACARACLAQSIDTRPPIVLTPSSGLAVVGVSLVRDGRMVGAVVGGYALVTFCESVAIAQLAHETGTSFQELWAEARRLQPISMRRLVLNGQLLQLLGDTLLREYDLRRQADARALQFSHLASHDALTGLPNRLLLADRLTQALTLAGRQRRQIAVFCLDIDRFKHINDSLGHPVGDAVLRHVAGAITGCVRRTDTVSRHGGDEFIVVLSELGHAADASDVARKVIETLAGLQTLAGQPLQVTVSIGISVFPDDGQDPETLLKCADMALYHAKAQGPGCYAFFQSELNVRALERQSIETELRGAIDRHEFRLLYQPKINLKTGAVTSAEALIRWQHPDHGLIAPARFVPIAEESGLIAPMGRWVLHEACRQAKAWQDAGLRPVPVSVNISALEFRNTTFFKNIADVLTRTRLEPRYLEIELTESVLMADVKATQGVLHALKRLGVQLAIDDFGTGWSSLSYLRQFHVDALKIDKSFMQEITKGSHTAPIVSAMIVMGKSLNQRVIAEGVETRDQLQFLQAEDCGEAQGYYFSPPMIAEQFARVLDSGLQYS